MAKEKFIGVGTGEDPNWEELAQHPAALNILPFLPNTEATNKALSDEIARRQKES